MDIMDMDMGMRVEVVGRMLGMGMGMRRMGGRLCDSSLVCAFDSDSRLRICALLGFFVLYFFRELFFSFFFSSFFA